MVSAVCLVSSCATVKKAREAQKEDGLVPGERTVTAAEAGLAPGSTKTLKELEEIGLKSHPSVLQSFINVEAAQLSIEDAKAGRKPSANASLGYNRGTKNADRHNTSTKTSDSFSGSLNLSYTLYDFGRTTADIRRAVAQLEAAEQTLRETKCAVVYDIRKAFFELRRAVELDAVAKLAVNQYQEHYDQVKYKHDIGSGTQYDVTKAEVDLSQSKLSSITTEHNVEMGWANLNKALGLAETPDYALAFEGIEEFPLDDKALMALALEDGDPQLAVLKARIKAANEYLERTISDLYPSFSLSLNGSISGSDFDFPILWNLTGAASIAQTLYAGGSKKRAIENAVLDLRQARSQLAQRQQTLYCNIRNAVLTAQRAQKQLEVAKLTEEQARQNLEIVNEQFDVGQASSVDRTDAQVQHSQAQAAAVTAKFDYLEAQAAIAKLIGR